MRRPAKAEATARPRPQRLALYSARYPKCWAVNLCASHMSSLSIFFRNIKIAVVMITTAYPITHHNCGKIAA